MVKFYETTFSYEYTWPAVTLAYFLRYPNPHSRHVVSSDVIDRHIDPATGELHTTRVHLKRGKLPATLTRFLPSISESYILEVSVINPKTMVMKTETRNLDHTGVLSVVELQKYTLDSTRPGITKVTSVVRFDSRLGNRSKATAAAALSEDVEEERKGVFGGIVAGWGKGSVQRTIEQFGVRRMGESVRGSKEGMKLVLERLRKAGLSGVTASTSGLGMGLVAGDDSRWKSVWRGLRDEAAFDVDIDGED